MRNRRRETNRTHNQRAIARGAKGAQGEPEGGKRGSSLARGFTCMCRLYWYILKVLPSPSSSLFPSPRAMDRFDPHRSVRSPATPPGVRGPGEESPGREGGGGERRRREREGKKELGHTLTHMCHPRCTRTLAYFILYQSLSLLILLPLQHRDSLFLSLVVASSRAVRCRPTVGNNKRRIYTAVDCRTVEFGRRTLAALHLGFLFLSARAPPLFATK